MRIGYMAGLKVSHWAEAIAIGLWFGQNKTY